MSDWIEVNMPWASTGEEVKVWAEYAVMPDLPEEMGIFGTCESEIRSKFARQIEAITKIQNEVATKFMFECFEKGGDGLTQEEHDEEDRHVEEAVLAKPKLRKAWTAYQILGKIIDWKHTQFEHPILAAWLKEREDKCKEARKANFLGAGLAQPGVEIELEGGRRMLIGHINQNGGVCDCCRDVEAKEIVVRYRVVVSPEELGVEHGKT